MSGRFENLPEDVRAALDRGEIIEAIKRLRMATGLGLKEAKDVIDAIVADRPLPPRPPLATSPSPPPFDGTLPADVLAVLAADGKIAAIKLLRERTGLGLKEAKDAIEATPVVPRSAPPSARATKAARTPTIVAESSLHWVSVVLVLLAIALIAGILWLLQ
jgi:ribosomal protein L7/L12